MFSPEVQPALAGDGEPLGVGDSPVPRQSHQPVGCSDGVEERPPATQEVGVRLPDGVEEDPVEVEPGHVEADKVLEAQPGVVPGLSEVAGHHQDLLGVVQWPQGRHCQVHLHLAYTQHCNTRS